MKFLSCVLVLALLCTAGSARADDFWGRDKALHFGVSAGLAAGGYGAAALFSEHRGVRLAVGGGLALGAGAAKELADLAGAGEPSWKDMAWNAIGTVTGLLIAWSLDLLIRGAARPFESPRAEGHALRVAF